MNSSQILEPGFIKKLATFGAVIYVSAGFGLFLSVADNYLGRTGSMPVPPTVLAIVFLISILSLVVLKDFLAGNPSLTVGMLIRSNMAVIAPFGLLASISLTMALQPTAFWGDGQKWIYLQSYDFFIFLAAVLIPGLPFIRKYFRFFIIVGLLTILISIFYEVQNPATFSSVPTRAAGFPGNSNWGALVSVMICTMSLGYKDGPSRVLDLVIFAITGLGIYFTLSRSGSLNLFVLIVFYVSLALYVGKNRFKTMGTLSVSIGSLICFFLLVVPIITENSNLMAGGSKAENRVLALFDGEIEDDGSAADRIEAARETLDRIEQSPILGHGTGFNRRMRQTPHNIYLKLWIDSGIFGLSAWLILLGSGFWLFTSRKYRPGQALIIATFFGGFFSHNILEQRTFLILLGTGASMSLYESAARFQANNRHKQEAALTHQAAVHS